MKTKQSILKELKGVIGKRWPLDLKGVVGEIGSGITISGEVIREDKRFWNLKKKFLHQQSEAFIRYFYLNYTKRHAKRKNSTTAK